MSVQATDVVIVPASSPPDELEDDPPDEVEEPDVPEPEELPLEGPTPLDPLAPDEPKPELDPPPESVVPKVPGLPGTVPQAALIERTTVPRAP